MPPRKLRRNYTGFPKYCEHCECYLNKSAYYDHKKQFFNEKLQTWSKCVVTDGTNIDDTKTEISETVQRCKGRKRHLIEIQNDTSVCKLHNLRKLPRFADFVFLTDDSTEILAHKAILTQYSSFVLQFCGSSTEVRLVSGLVCTELKLSMLDAYNEFTSHHINTMLDFVYGLKVDLYREDFLMQVKLAVALNMPEYLTALFKGLSPCPKAQLKQNPVHSARNPEPNSSEPTKLQIYDFYEKSNPRYQKAKAQTPEWNPPKCNEWTKMITHTPKRPVSTAAECYGESSVINNNPNPPESFDEIFDTGKNIDDEMNYETDGTIADKYSESVITTQSSSIKSDQCSDNITIKNNMTQEEYKMTVKSVDMTETQESIQNYFHDMTCNSNDMTTTLLDANVETLSTKTETAELNIPCDTLNESDSYVVIEKTPIAQLAEIDVADTKTDTDFADSDNDSDYIYEMLLEQLDNESSDSSWDDLDDLNPFDDDKDNNGNNYDDDKTHSDNDEKVDLENDDSIDNDDKVHNDDNVHTNDDSYDSHDTDTFDKTDFNDCDSDTSSDCIVIEIERDEKQPSSTEGPKQVRSHSEENQFITKEECFSQASKLNYVSMVKGKEALEKEEPKHDKSDKDIEGKQNYHVLNLPKDANEEEKISSKMVKEKDGVKEDGTAPIEDDIQEETEKVKWAQPGSITQNHEASHDDTEEEVSKRKNLSTVKEKDGHKVEKSVPSEDDTQKKTELESLEAKRGIITQCEEGNAHDDPEGLIVFNFRYSGNRSMTKGACTHCDEMFDNVADLRKHLETAHNMVSCSICQKRIFVYHRAKVLHELSHKDSYPYIIYKDNWVLRYKCFMCPKEFTHSYKMTVHLATYHQLPPKKYHCPKCNIRFTKITDFDSHFVKHFEDLKEYECTCNLCGKVLTGGQGCFKAHMQAVHELRKDHMCSICGHKTNQRNNLQRHMITMHTSAMKKSLDFKCDICGKTFALKETLARHMDTHSKPYICSICGQKSISSENLKRHWYTHTDKKRFHCFICGKGYNEKRDVIRHSKSAHHVNIGVEQILMTEDQKNFERELVKRENPNRKNSSKLEPL